MPQTCRESRAVPLDEWEKLWRAVDIGALASADVDAEFHVRRAPAAPIRCVSPPLPSAEPPRLGGKARLRRVVRNENASPNAPPTAPPTAPRTAECAPPVAVSVLRTELALLEREHLALMRHAHRLERLIDAFCNLRVAPG